VRELAQAEHYDGQLLSALFNDAVLCNVDSEWTSMEYWWNDTDGGKM